MRSPTLVDNVVFSTVMSTMVPMNDLCPVSEIIGKDMSWGTYGMMKHNIMSVFWPVFLTSHADESRITMI